jgi:hypothetical protein
MGTGNVTRAGKIREKGKKNVGRKGKRRRQKGGKSKRREGKS